MGIDSLPAKLATAFHESFSLSLPSLSQILQVANGLQNSEEVGKGLTYDVIKQNTTLGNNYVKAMRRYARAVGLLDVHERITPFGEIACRFDPELRHTATLWVMQYHLCAPHLSGPAFWANLVSECLVPGKDLTSEGIAVSIESFLYNRGDRPLASRTLKTTATVFLGTYKKSDGLGPLGFFGSGSSKTVCEPVSPGLQTAAYAIADYWHGEWADVKTVNLSSMTEPGGPAALLYMSSGDINAVLRQMASQGLVEVNRKVPPYQVVRLWNSPEDLLEHLYD